MEQPAETLSNGPVELRRWQVADVDVLAQLIEASLDHLRPWMPWADAHDRRATADYLDRVQEDWATGRAFDYAITTDGEVVGSCGLMRRIGPGGMEIGYWISPGRTGRGLVTMSVAALVRAAFALPEVTHVEIHHDEANKASGAVPQRLGFTVVSRAADPARGAAPGESGVSVVHRLRRGQ